MIIAGIILWLLLGFLAMLAIRRHDGTLPLLIAIFFILAGAITLLIVFGAYLMNIEV